MAALNMSVSASSTFSALKSRHLQDLAFFCGLPVSGTKTSLVTSLNAGLKNWTPLPKNARILSIDMGVKNLAYSLIEPKDTKTAARYRLHAWERLAVLSDVPGQPADWTTPSLSAAAVSLVKDRLLPLAPTHVVIEQQRFRSGGGAGIFEWTVRVNSLEAMLHALLAYARSTGAWTGTVVQADPRRVSDFVLGEQTRGSVAGDVKAVATKSTQLKVAKIRVLRERLLRSDSDVVCDRSREAELTMANFLQRTDPDKKITKRSRKAKEPGDECDLASQVVKQDDLADSLLQGLTWLQWHKNQKILLDEGAEGLLRACLGLSGKELEVYLQSSATSSTTTTTTTKQRKPKVRQAPSVDG